MLVTHANMKGFGLTPLFGHRRGYMPPHLKRQQKHFGGQQSDFSWVTLLFSQLEILPFFAAHLLVWAKFMQKKKPYTQSSIMYSVFVCAKSSSTIARP